MRIAYLGPEGTFSEEAARTSLAANEAAGHELVALPTVHDTVRAVHNRTVDRAVVPIENSVEGPVGVTLDTLASEETDVVIVAEVVLAVSQSLIARAPLALERIERVVSHPQATAQCARYLRDTLPGAAVALAPSTAEAVRLVVAQDAPWAALSTRRAAELYGGVVLAEGVEDDPGNATRFVWLARRDAAPQPVPGSAGKTSLSFWGEGDERPGWLVRCLSEFAFRGVNLTKIESRPQRGRLGHYRFFVDCAGWGTEPPVAEAVQGLRAHCEQVTVLGSYPPAG
ncbi:MAG: prephenate dehydratase [Actinomycetota bacterium]|nr:prephenate dehydratase [Actinomycetota bacterium]